MKHLNLRTKIITAFCLAFLAFLGALSHTVLQLRDIGEGLSVVEEGYLPLARIGAIIESTQETIEQDLSLIIEDRPRPNTGGAPISVAAATRLTAALERGDLIVSNVLPSVNAAEERANLNFIQGQLSLIYATHSEQTELVQEILDLTNRRADESLPESERLSIQVELSESHEAMLENSRQMSIEVVQMSSRIDSSARRVTERTSEAQQQAVVVSGTLTVAALVFGVVMLILAVVAIAPIRRLTSDVQRIAGGDYGARATSTRSDELGILASEMNQMAASIQQRDDDLRRRAEELEAARFELRAILDSIRIGLVVVTDDIASMANPAAIEMWQIKLNSSLPADLANIELSENIVFLDGRTFEVHKTSFREGYIIVGEDVSQALIDRERLARSERLALVGQMLGQIAHEVRNPLNAMSLNAELLGDDLSLIPSGRQQESRDILNTMTSEIRRLEALTEHYLTLVRRPTPTLEAHDPHDLSQGVARLLDELLKKKGAELSITGAPIESVQVDGDQIRQALLNIVQNGIEAGADKIEINLELHKNKLSFHVTDNGPGMTSETANRAMDPFFSTKAQGTGLGLAITRQIVEDHGGTMEVSPMKDGTKISLHLPSK